MPILIPILMILTFTAVQATVGRQYDKDHMGQPKDRYWSDEKEPGRHP